MVGLNEILKIFRVINEYDLKEVCEKTGLVKSTISCVEIGNRKIKQTSIEKLARAYKVDYKDIIAISDKCSEEALDYVVTLYHCVIAWLNHNSMFEDENTLCSYEMSMAKVFKALRIVNRIKPAEVAKAMGYCSTRVYSIENGENLPTLKGLDEYARMYKVRASKILKVQEDCRKYHWNFQKVLFEVLLVWMEENS